MKNKLCNVLITSGGGYQGLAIIKGLRESAKIRIILTDIYQENTSKYLCDKFIRSPPVKDASVYIEFLLNICLNDHVDIIIPATEYELLTLAARRELFLSHNIYIATSEYNALLLFCDKKNSTQLFQDNQVNVLPLIDPLNHNYKFPLFAKTRKGWGSKGTLTVYQKDNISNINISEYIWQEYIQDFKEYSVDFAVSFAGNISDWVTRERLRSFSGLCCIGQNVIIPELDIIIESVTKLIKQSGGIGIFNVQFIKSRERFFLSDINPRIGTSSVFSTGLGNNLPLFLCADVQSKKNITPGNRPPGNQPEKKLMFRTLSEKWFCEFDSSIIKNIIFDLDDTLFNQKKWIFFKIKELLQTTRVPVVNNNEFLLRFMQLIEEGDRSTPFTVLAEEFELSCPDVEQLIQEYRLISPAGEFLYNDSLPVLFELQQRGYNLILLTDNPPSSQQQKILAADMSVLFDHIIFTRDYEVEKPDLSCFERVEIETGCLLENSIMIGDNLYRDIFGALKSGCFGAFFIQRNNTLFNNDESIFNEILEMNNIKRTFYSITCLREILFYLSSNK
jgi:FMN phosphatase YigB (HAD superfamily)